MPKIDEFFIELGLDAKGANMTLGDIIGKMAGMKLTTLGVIDGLRRFGNFWKDSTFFTASASLAFTNFAAATNLSWKELQKWQIAGRMVNVDAGAVAGSIVGLQQKLIALNQYGTGLEPFAKLGVAPGSFKDVFPMMEKMSEVAQRLGGPLFNFYASMAGIDPSIIRLMLTTAAQRKEALVASGLSEADMLAGQDFNTAWNEFKIQFDQFKYYLGGVALPFLTGRLKEFNSLFSANSTSEEKAKAVSGLTWNGIVSPIGTAAKYLTHPGLLAHRLNGDVRVSITTDSSKVAEDTARAVSGVLSPAEQMRALGENYETFPPIVPGP